MTANERTVSAESGLGEVVHVVRNFKSDKTHLAEVNTRHATEGVAFGKSYVKPVPETRALCGVSISDGVVMREDTKVRCSTCRRLVWPVRSAPLTKKDACSCGCPPDMHVGEIGCPCALPGEPPCVTTPACACGRVWEGHPNPHAITCPMHVTAPGGQS